LPGENYGRGMSTPLKQWSIEGILSSPLLWGVVCLVTIALALSGRLDMTAAKLVLILAWLMASFAIYRFAPILTLPVILRLLVTTCLASAFGIGLWFLSEWMSAKPLDVPASAPSTVPMGRLKYSSRQTLQLSPMAAPSDQVLNLDNIALLRLHVPSSLHSVTLAMLKNAPLTIAEPQADKEYKDSDGTIAFPSAGKGLEIRGFASYSIASTYEFTTTNRVQIIPVKDRAFRVTLDEINEKSSKGIPRTDYVFAISEESPDSPAQPPIRPEMAAEQPYIYARLAIEPADKDSARLRLEIENGKIPIENVRYTKSAIGFSHFEGAPSMARMMAPGAKFSELISPIPLKASEYGRILVNIYFDAKLNGVTKHFIATHRFLLQKEDIKAQQLDPESSSYAEGLLEPAQQIEEVSNQFAQPQGTLSFVVHEKNENGDWNLVSGGNDQRRFTFNPETKVVSFATKTQSGRDVSISEPLMVNDNMKHMIIIAWSPYGGSLHVDGRGRADFDDGHNPDHRMTKPTSPTPDKGASPPPPTS
jgi:hypothetical protein